MTKVSIHIWVNEAEWKEFKRFCLKKYGKLHQVLGEELSLAIRHYLECVSPSPSHATMVPSAHTQHTDHVDDLPRANSKLIQELEAIVAEIAKDFEVGGQIPVNVLRRKILNVVGPCGSKKINDRITMLQDFGVIEQDLDFKQRRVYTVKKLSLWTGGPHGHPDPAGGLRSKWTGHYRV
jgi:hypothetical protein